MPQRGAGGASVRVGAGVCTRCFLLPLQTPRAIDGPEPPRACHAAPASTPAASTSPCPRQDEPEALRADLEVLLASHGVAYEYSKTSKFANFINRTLV